MLPCLRLMCTSNSSGANARPNVNDVLADEEDDELVRRFFLFDRVRPWECVCHACCAWAHRVR